MSLHARVLERLAPWRDAPAWRVAFSGGLDSTVLLHLLARLAQREALPPISAIHVHHGLQAAADAWPDHCRRQCEALGIPLHVQSVAVVPGASLERAARDARYGAFTALLGAGEVLLTAQHREDQAETLLFRLLRGAGVRGLAGMPASRALGRGHLLRPLLDCARSELEAYAAEHRLSWVDDPSNADGRFARNYLRHQVMPLLRARWPQAERTLARSARHLGEAAQLLDELAQLDLQAAQAPSPLAWLSLPSLALAPLRRLSTARLRNALRYWLRELTPMPDAEHWAGWQALLEAADDAAPIWRLAGGELHRADERLWWLAGDWLLTPPCPILTLESEKSLTLPGNGYVRIEGHLPGQGDWRLAYRQGGERMAVAGRGHRDLKRLLNERRLPAFVRGRLPLLLCDGEVRAVANLPGLDGAADGSWRLAWRPPVCDPGLS
ncbi:tRNA lysidine(34) synthetase TilS [Pseudomonas lalucatii]|uniref:tRNA(Ile)-lysidine synthase n=1 Tax=Pseudomonas lalucatii TaxID=1424203 RepID=A0ABS5Q5Q8_9PSED|nr:tRNA lysidine(34) synthetase TilS [Pseudomonas lalucatii]MBS7663449.1 tRNA lysidine(34) synthetase TilS [Pseudomonas lalucatii]MBS7725027.1 tRNA lysidine(34) synthetase TilS [Pseudomonas lalucatii]QVM87008.1 tRNA lysidine(34) synthetase TilS [Pseudomonas lalucatii]